MKQFVHDRTLLKTAVLNSAQHRPKSARHSKSAHRPKPLSLVRYRLNDTLKQNKILRQQLNNERHLNNLLQQIHEEFKNAIDLYSKLLEKTTEELEDNEQQKKMIKHFEKILSDSSCKLEETFY